MREHRKPHAHDEHTASEGTDRAPNKHTVDHQAADAAARRMAAVPDDGLVVEDSDPETERLRGVLRERVTRRELAVHEALAKFTSILRHRKAEGTIKKGLSREGVEDRFSEGWTEYLAEQVFDLAGGVAEAAEIALDPAMGAVEKVQGVVGDHVAAEQAVAEVSAIDEIVFDAGAAARAEALAAKDRVSAMFHADVRALVEQPEIPVDQHAIIAKLDALVLEAMRASGTQTVGEQMGALKERGGLDAEIDEADRAAKRTNRKAGVEE